MSTHTLNDIIKRDHNRILGYYKDQKAATDRDAQKRLSDQFLWQIIRHSIIEELVVHPLLISAEGNLEKEVADHQELNKRLYKLLSHQSDSSDASQLDRIFRVLVEHFQEEERMDLPFLEEKVSRNVLEAAANKFHIMRTWFPDSRSHLATPGGLLGDHKNAKIELESFFNGKIANQFGTTGRVSRRN